MFQDLWEEFRVAVVVYSMFGVGGEERGCTFTGKLNHNTTRLVTWSRITICQSNLLPFYNDNHKFPRRLSRPP